jgi:GMP synthase-like glutamine amidotransferase
MVSDAPTPLEILAMEDVRRDVEVPQRADVVMRGDEVTTVFYAHQSQLLRRVPRADGGDGESWHVYHAVGEEIPTDVEAASFDGFVIFGSCVDTHDDEPWILDLVDLIHLLHATGKRILDVCFGHQVPIPYPSMRASPVPAYSLFGSVAVGSLVLP